jgi:hypothetical protein
VRRPLLIAGLRVAALEVALENYLLLRRDDVAVSRAERRKPVAVLRPADGLG